MFYKLAALFKPLCSAPFNTHLADSLTLVAIKLHEMRFVSPSDSETDKQTQTQCMHFISQLKMRLGKYASIGLIDTAHLPCASLAHLSVMQIAGTSYPPLDVNMQMGIFITNCRHLPSKKSVPGAKTTTEKIQILRKM